MERVTVTLPTDLVEKIDRLERNRSRFIAEAVEHELVQRRRDALLQSVQNPHPETTELVDVGLSEWIADLATDETRRRAAFRSGIVTARRRSLRHRCVDASRG